MKAKTAVVFILFGCAAPLVFFAFSGPLGSQPKSPLRIEDAGEDPDMPPGFAGNMSRGEFIAQRAEYIAMRRGIFRGKAADLRQRQEAILTMEGQERRQASLPGSPKINASLTQW